MYSDAQTSAIMSAGMKVLYETLGALETEIFIANIGSKRFDYAEWRTNLWEDLTPRELFEKAAKNYQAPAGVQRV
jgi:hypothetical protein